MMFARLNELTRPGTLDVSANSARLKQKPTSRSRQENGLLPLPRRIAALLIQYPELIDSVTHKEILWGGMEFPGVELFKGIFSDIKENKPANTAILLEQYRGHPHEKAIKYLASLELFVKGQQIDSTAVTNEFIDAFDNLLSQAKKKAEFRKLMADAKND
jgi:DNA primase